jgi:hypothetical protein
MTPDGKTVTRKLTAWVESTDDGKTKVEPLGSTELAKIAKAYGVEPPPAEPKKQTFQGRFAGLLPDDVGGKGWYLHWENSLGSVTTYSERFRGDDDLTEELNRRLAGANQVADTLVAWAAAEFKEAEGYDALHQYLDVDFRRDINNLSLYWWSYTSLGREEEVTAGEGMFRIGQYLAERGYFDPQEAPQVMRAMQEASQGRPHGLLRFFQRLVATRMGVPADKPIPLFLRFLADQDLVKASLDRFLEKTERYQALVEQWRREVRDAPEL